jgi:hypothetical protein
VGKVQFSGWREQSVSWIGPSIASIDPEEVDLRGRHRQSEAAVDPRAERRMRP